MSKVTLTAWTPEGGGYWRMKAPAGDGGHMSWTTKHGPPEDALTLGHLVSAVAACELVARDLRVASNGASPSIAWYEECAARLRRAIESAEVDRG